WDKNLAYLTGVTDRKAYLLIVPDGVAVEFAATRSTPELMAGHKVREILFMEPRSEQDTFMESEGGTFASILGASGVDRVFDLAELNGTLQRALMATDMLWFNTPSTPQIGKPLPPELIFANEIRERFYWVTLRNIATTIHELRWVKDDYEVE